MNYIVFDLEWNQSPEGKERSDRYLQFEIVEIGGGEAGSEPEAYRGVSPPGQATGL